MTEDPDHKPNRAETLPPAAEETLLDKETTPAAAEAGGANKLPSRSGRYFIEHGRILQDSLDRQGVNHPRVLSEFVARIDQQIEKDDGLEAVLFYRISGEHPSGKPLKSVDVLASAFPTMVWIASSWGNDAIVTAGQTNKDCLREGIQRLSVPEYHRVFIHTGWRMVDGQWCYLHGGGAIGAQGPLPNIEVQLEGRLAHYAFPNPLEGAALEAAWASSVRLLDLGADLVTAPLFLAVFRGAMGECPFSIHVSGAPFQGKTEVCGIVTGHYGPGLRAQNTLEAWSSTAGAIERSLFLTKDAVGLVDDFKPSGSRREIEDMHQKADRVFRSGHNRHGRSRLQADGRGVRSDNHPRGLTLSTGEELPEGYSLRSRVLMLDWPARTMNWDLLTSMQLERDKGLHAGLLAAFVGWVAKDRESYLALMGAERQEAAKRFQADNKRTAHIVADLWSVWAVIQAFVEAHALLSASECERLRVRLVDALQGCSSSQAEHLKTSDPAQRFLEQLRACLLAGKAHLDPAKGEMPAVWEARMGWNPDECSRGDALGYFDLEGSELWLFPSVAYQEVSKLGDLGIGSQALWKLLGERGTILRDDQGWRPKRTLPKGGRSRVIVLKLASFEDLEEGSGFSLGNLGNLGRASSDHGLQRPSDSEQPGQGQSEPGQEGPEMHQEAAQIFESCPSSDPFQNWSRAGLSRAAI